MVMDAGVYLGFLFLLVHRLLTKPVTENEKRLIIQQKSYEKNTIYMEILCVVSPFGCIMFV